MKNDYSSLVNNFITAHRPDAALKPKEGDQLTKTVSVVSDEIKDSLKNEDLRRIPPNKKFKEPLPEPRENLGSGLKNRRSRIFQWFFKPVDSNEIGPIGSSSTIPSQAMSAPDPNILSIISDNFFNGNNITESPFAELIGRYHPDPNNAKVQSIVESDPDSKFACGIGRNSFLDYNQEWVINQVLIKNVSLFSIGVAGNENYQSHKYHSVNLFNHQESSGIKKLTHQQQRKNLFLEALASRKNLPGVKDSSFNSLYHRVILNEGDLDTLVARGYGKNPVIDPDYDRISSLVERNYDTEFACGVAQNPRLNFQSEMVRRVFLNYPNSKFVLGLAHHPRMSPDINLNMIRLKKDDPAYRNFFRELDKNPHYQLRKALKKDLPGLEQAIRANPEEAKKIPLGRLLLEEGIVSLAA